MKYTVHLNAMACASYSVEADSPKEAYEKVIESLACLSDIEGTDWDTDHPGEVSDDDGNYVNINDLPDYK
jgi:hypothetical protein